MQKTIKLSLISVALLSSLHAQEVELETITVVSATKSEQSLKDLTSNVSIITSDELKEKHYTTAIQALNTIAGISYTSNGGIGSSTSLNLRGAGNNRTLVLIDGVRYQDPSNINGASIGHLMIEDIEQIEVIKGAQSGIWGADASAGVINIITKSAKDGTHGSANVEAGGFNTKKYGVTASHKNSKFDAKFSANKITSDSFTNMAPRDEDIGDYEDDAYSNLTLNFKANYYITENAKISLGVTSIDAIKDYDTASPDDETMKSDISDRLYNLAYSQTYNNHNFTLKVEQSKFSRDEIGTVAAWGMEFLKEFDGEYNNIEFSDNIKYNEKDFIVFGLGSSSDEASYIMTDNSKEEKTNRDNYLYLTNSNTLNKIILTESIRYDDYNNFDSKATGKLGIKYNINNDTFITSNVGLAYNVPTITQKINPWGKENDELNPENTTSFDISAGYKNFKATYFYNIVTDLIEWYDPDGWGGIPPIYKNLDGESIFKGIELEYSQNITDSLLVSLNYCLLSAKDKDGKNLARRAEETAKLSVDYYPIDALHIGVFGEYIGKRYNGNDDDGEQTGRYNIVNLVTNYDINSNFSAYAKVDNLFDTYYQVVDGYATAPLSAYVGMNAKF
ncbi:MAG: TonB-dependent receptor [Campylobacterota bacterium]|nr:TonB-dependent receptor [Campylobacterota bacterium]